MARRVGRFQNDIPELPELDAFRYENIFRMYETETDEQYFFFNILNTVNVPEDIDPDFYREVILTRREPWSVISFREYGTMDLWWLIVIVNNINNPVAFPPPGTKLRIIRKPFLKTIVDDIKRQLR